MGIGPLKGCRHAVSLKWSLQLLLRFGHVTALQNHHLLAYHWKHSHTLLVPLRLVAVENDYSTNLQ